MGLPHERSPVIFRNEISLLDPVFALAADLPQQFNPDRRLSTVDLALKRRTGEKQWKPARRSVKTVTLA
jgi:hypothetical protein